MVSCWKCAQEKVGGQKCDNRRHILERILPELEQHFEDCKVEWEEAEECGDLEDRIEAGYRLADAKGMFRSAEIELERIVYDEESKPYNAALTGRGPAPAGPRSG